MKCLNFASLHLKVALVTMHQCCFISFAKYILKCVNQKYSLFVYDSKTFPLKIPWPERVYLE